MLLAVVMVFGLLPMTAFATQETDPAVAAILARIEALPDPADFPTMTKGELQAVLDETNAIFDLYDALTKEQQKLIDLTPLFAMYEAEGYLGSAPVANPVPEAKPDYLSVTNIGTGTATLKWLKYGNPKQKLQYSTDGATFNDVTLGSTEITLAPSAIVYFKGNYSAVTLDNFNYIYLSCSGEGAALKLGGDLTTLLNGTGNVSSLADYSAYLFYYLFKNLTALTDASELKLPSATLKNYCYMNMFYGCTSLVNAPALPATTLAEYCYSSMFYNCKLVNAPALPAMNLATNCYESMFWKCASLVNAPAVLPAMNLAENCYMNMFSGCTSLVNAPALPATNLAKTCYTSMFLGCESLVNVPAVLPATTLTENCYQAMFSGCKSLVNAPALSATNLAKTCCFNMFKNCTSLVNAPALLATTLAESCYNQMFSGCKSLLSLSVGFNKFDEVSASATNPTYLWLNDVTNVTPVVPDGFDTSYTPGSSTFPNGITPVKASDARTITNNAPQTAAAANNGYLIVKDKSFKDDIVTITVKPAENYKLTEGSLKVEYQDRGSKTIIPEQDEKDTTKYSFSMPNFPVSISAEFKIAHEHSFSYSPDGAVLTATCGSGCPDGYDTTPLTLTLTGDVDVNAAAVKAWNDAGAAEVTLKYFTESDTEFKNPLDAPVKSGKYVAKASVTYGDTPTTVTATKEIDYVSPYYYINEKNEKVELETMPTIVTKDTTTLAADGWYYVKGTVTINNAVTLNGNANLILADGASLEITGGIAGYKTLTVYAQTDGSGKLTASPESTGMARGMGGSVTVNGGNVKLSGKTDYYNCYGVDGNVTVNGGSVEISGTGNDNVNGSAYGVNGNVTVNGGTATISSDGCGVSGGVTVSGGEVEISGSDGVTQNVTVSGGTATISGDGYGVTNGSITVSGDGVLTLSGGTMAAAVANEKVDAAVQTSSDGVTYTDWDGKTNLNTYKYLKLTTGACAELTHGGVATMYKTLKEAIKAAADGDTVKLTSNAKGDGIVIPADTFTTGLTLDLGGFTYTVDGALVGSTNTETNGFQLLKGNKITMKNGTVNVGDNVKGKFNGGDVTECRILIQNYSDLTLDGVELDGSKLKDSRTDRGTYTLSNCCGNTELTGKTAIKASTEETDPSFAFDTDEKTGYTKPSVTVNGAGVVITGDVELSGGDLTLTNGTISGALKGDKGNGTVTKAATFTATAPDGYGWDKDNKLIEAEAEVNGAAYPTIEEAIEAANSGDTIKLTSDLKLTKQLEISKAITLDGIDKKIDGSGISGTGAILVTAGATLKNFELTGPNTNTSGWDSGEYGIKFYQANGAKLTDVKVTGANAGIQVNGGSVTMTDTIDVSGNEFGGIEVCKKGALVISAATLKNDTEDAAANANPVLWNDGDGKVENMGTITGSGSLNKKLTDDTTKDHYFLSGTPEAKINGQPYLTLADALKDAKASQTIELLDNLTLTEQLVIDKAITLNGKGKTVTRTPNTGAAYTRAGILVTAGATIMNLTVSGPNTTARSGNSGWDEGEYGIKFFNANNATLNEVTVKNANAGIQVNGGKVHFTSSIDVSGNEWGGIEVCNKGELDISTATLKNTSETDANPVLWNDGGKDNSFGTVTFNAEDQLLYKKTVKNDNENKEHYYTDGAAKLTSDGKDSYYRTLEDALAAAGEDDVVTLLKDITTEGFTVKSGVTLDLNGKTVTPATAPNFKGISNKGTIKVYSANADQLGYLLYDAVDENGGKYITGGHIKIGAPLEAGIGSNTEILAKRTTDGKQSITVTVTDDSDPKLVIWNLPVGKDTEITVNGKLRIGEDIEIKGKVTCTTLIASGTITLTDGGQLIVTDLKDAADAAETAIDTAAGNAPSEAVQDIVAAAKKAIAALADPTTVGNGDNTVENKVAAIAVAADKACLDIVKKEAIEDIEERAGSENRRSEEVQGYVDEYTQKINEAATVDEVNKLLDEAFEAIPEQSECPIPGFIGWIVNSVLHIVRWIIARITFEKYEPIIIGGAIVKIIGDVFVR